MKVIGLRVFSNSVVHYCIIEKLQDDSLNYLDISQINIPLSINRPEALNFTRNTLLDILEEYEVKSAVIRIPEFGRTINGTAIERSYIEGVIQESLASSTVDNFLAGQIAELTRIAGFPKTDFKKYADAELDFPTIPDGLDWKKLGIEKRECILACFTAFNL
jgi:hypothetical protein